MAPYTASDHHLYIARTTSTIHILFRHNAKRHKANSNANYTNLPVETEDANTDHYAAQRDAGTRHRYQCCHLTWLHDASKQSQHDLCL